MALRQLYVLKKEQTKFVKLNIATKEWLNFVLFLPVCSVKLSPVWEQTGFAIIQQSTEINARIPVCGEIVDPAFWQNGLKFGEQICYLDLWM